MGSFSDLVIQKDGKVLEKEDDELLCLRTELFGIVNDIIIEQRGGLTFQDFDGEHFIPIERVKEIYYTK